MTTHHIYYTRANKSTIMADYESDNAIVRETLTQVQGRIDLFQGNMKTFLEILQTQRAHISANPATTNVTHAAEVTNATVDVAVVIETLMETVTSTTVNHHLVPSVVNRLVASYPQGMSLNFAAQFANGGAFIPHQALFFP